MPAASKAAAKGRREGVRPLAAAAAAKQGAASNSKHLVVAAEAGRVAVLALGKGLSAFLGWGSACAEGSCSS